MPLMSLVALQFEVLGDLAFILKLVVFIYLAYFLYITFRGGVVFGIALLGAAYLVFFYSISTTVLLVLFLVFVIFGTHIQMLVDFGLGRIFQLAGKAPPWEPEMAERMRLEELERKHAQGTLNPNEANELGQLYQYHPQAAQMMQQQPGRPKRRLF